MISTMFETSDSIEALDCNFGVGNLAFTVLNHVNKRFFLTGIENQVLLADVAKHYADMIQEEVTINNQDALDLFFPEMNLVFSDLAKGEVNKENYHSELYDKGIRDFAYLMIEKYLAMDGYCRYIYLVENTFFQKDTKGIFKDFLLKNAHIEAFVCLPNSFFQKPEDAKAILILDNHPENHNLGTNVYVLPTPIQNFKQFQEIMSAIKEDIRRANE
jgi:site-specific DNA-methyltransferase (adenine-specific)